MREASARRRRRKTIFLSLVGALALGAAIWLAVHFIPKPLTWLLPKQSASEVLYWLGTTSGGPELIELDDEQQAELILLLEETNYRRVPKCKCDNRLKMLVRYKDGTTALIGEHWVTIEKGDSSRSFSIKLFDGDALFEYAPEGILIKSAE